MAAYFSLILVLVTLGSGLIWLLDVKVFKPKRLASLSAAQSNGQISEEAAAKITQEPAIVETSRSIFPVIAFVLVLRSFLWEPFQIPSGSMMPTLLVGDFILVEKFAYGLKDPVWRNKLVETGEPKRGDVAVFKYPVDTRIDYIKRIVGLPGDTIRYRNKQLYIKPACDSGENCQDFQLVSRSLVNRDEYFQGPYPLTRYTEQLGEVSHDILVNTQRPDPIGMFFQEDGVPRGDFVVPEGHYFGIGDNRDNSTDSRFWGFIKDEHLVGKAVAIWISFEFERSEDSLLPTWIPTGVRFNRVGGIS
ncbi:signal peptidase I [Paraferrimonas sedimenticola]|uniref:Signal peptidase I n=1 Tax=Paraferrimonas sedimenticola TaxID=375674 RepID=A0AA37RWU7_9GAMM|nr:signal peptidase I [Paraferrimonas sedimenticola]GLP97190.1 signal peptidase I [Paraferrimonas sedimenticola]